MTTQATVTALAEFRNQRARSAASAAPVAGPARTLPTVAQSPPTGTVTFLLTDIEGSTPRWDTHGDAMAAAVRRHYDILDAAVSAYGGFRPLEQGEGDSLVAAFPRASDAAAATLQAQGDLLVEDWPAGADVAVRMALHTGEARLRDDLYYAGPSIIRCARLRALAHGGQILVSASTADLLVDALPDDSTLIPLGRHRLKGLRTPEDVYQLLHPGLPTSFPPLPTVDGKPTNVPIQLTSFIGRRAELDELADLITRHRLVTVVGGGGFGKTRLAAQAAGEIAVAFADGVWWIELAEVAEPDAVPAAVLAALGLDARGLPPVDRLAAYLSERQVLLVLDNCEHVLGAAAQLTETVLRSSPEARILATSQAPLGVRGELTWRVGALGLPPEFDPSDEVPVEQILAAEAVQLFGDRAAQVRSGFRVDPANAATVAAICRRVDGIPLAVELAASRVGVLRPARILAGLDDRFRLLAGTGRGIPARQQTLAASVEWSHDLLTEPARILLRRLAVFTGTFGLEAAEDVAADPDLDRWGVLGQLATLVDKSLVAFDGERYLLQQTIRDFAASKLEAAGETAACRDRHLAHHLDVAATGAKALAAGASIAVLEELEAARTNLLAAADWALTCGDHDAAARIVGDLTLFWQLHGRHSESLTFLRRVLDALPPEPTAVRARVLWALGHLGIYGMDQPHGYGLAETMAAVEVATAIGCDEILGRALASQGMMTAFADPSAALDVLATARAAADRAGDPYGRGAAAVYSCLATVFGSDRADLAAPHLAELANEADSTGNATWEIWYGLISGVEHLRAGRLREAVASLTAADEVAWAVGDPTLESWCAVWLAESHVELGEYEPAERVIARAETWMDRSSLGRIEFVRSRRIRLELRRGDVPAARARQAEIEQMNCLTDFPFVPIELGQLRARFALQEGDLTGARAAIEDTLRRADELGTPWYRISAANVAGRIARGEGNGISAEDAHHRALALSLEHGLEGVAAETLDCLAALAADGESWVEAARLYGAAEAIRARTGLVRPPLDAPGVEADLAVIRAALGDAEFAPATAEGAALSLSEVVAYATRARGERRRPSMGWESLTPTEESVVLLAADAPAPHLHQAGDQPSGRTRGPRH